MAGLERVALTPLDGPVLVTGATGGVGSIAVQLLSARGHEVWAMTGRVAEHEAVAGNEAVGRVSAELVAPYPPGVPVLAPGERITSTALAALREARDAGTRIAYAADPSLATLRVLR